MDFGIFWIDCFWGFGVRVIFYEISVFIDYEYIE